MLSKLQTQTASTSCYSNRHGGCCIAAFCDGGCPSVAEIFVIEVISDLRTFCCNSSSFFVSACSQYFAILLLSSHDSPKFAGFGTFGVICTAQHHRFCQTTLARRPIRPCRHSTPLTAGCIDDPRPFYPRLPLKYPWVVVQKLSRRSFFFHRFSATSSVTQSHFKRHT